MKIETAGPLQLSQGTGGGVIAARSTSEAEAFLRQANGCYFSAVPLERVEITHCSDSPKNHQDM